MSFCSRQAGVAFIEYIMLAALLLLIASPSLESVFTKGSSKLCRSALELDQEEAIAYSADCLGPMCIPLHGDRNVCYELVEQNESKKWLEGFDLSGN